MFLEERFYYWLGVCVDFVEFGVVEVFVYECVVDVGEVGDLLEDVFDVFGVY